MPQDTKAAGRAAPAASAIDLVSTPPDDVRLRVLASFWAVVLVGLPFWWATTEIHRAPLPYSEIDRWAEKKACDVRLSTHVTLHLADAWNHSSFAGAVSMELAGATDKFWKSREKRGHAVPEASGIQLPVVVIAKVLSREGQDAVKKSEQDPTALRMYAAKQGHVISPPGQYHVYVSPDASNERTFVRVAEYRYASIFTPKAHAEKTVSDILASFFLPEHARLAELARELVAGTKESEDTAEGGSTKHRHGGQLVTFKRERSAADAARVVTYSPRYRITFSLMIADPADVIVSWDVNKAVEAYLRPLLDELSPLSQFVVESQIQYYAPLTFLPPKRQLRDGLTFYALLPEVLPHVINSAEWTLASPVTSDPSLNFILYIPPAASSPLLILDSTGKPVPSNAFLLPRWGGVVVDNSAVQSSVRRAKFHYGVEGLRPIMEVFVAQLRGLLGVSAVGNGFAAGATNPAIHVVVDDAPDRGVTDLEFDGVLRMRTAQNVVAAVATVKSLAALVRQIGNMVVLEHIRTEIVHALDELRLSCTALHANSTVTAFAHARNALDGAERAFFDPTMVSMLYFPDEHKYAIYMPLFVPISVPLVVTVFKELKARKRARVERMEIKKRKVE